MPEIAPFRGWRYNERVVDDLARVLAPPYDVVDSNTVQALLDASPYNVIRLELPTAALQTTSGRCPYREAAILLRDWARHSVLVRDTAPTLYLYEQQFSASPCPLTRTAIIARLRLAPPGEGIYPHEQTMSGPKADRRRLLEWTRANVSPIFGIYDDDTNSVASTMREYAGQPTLDVVDRHGVRHTLRSVTEPAIVRQICQAIQAADLFIADGHHRYETALRHAHFCHSVYQDIGAAGDPADYVLAALVPSGDPGLVIWPTHRAIRGSRLDSRQLHSMLAQSFDIEHVGHGPDAGRDAWQRLNATTRLPALAIGTASDQTWLVLRPKSIEPIRRRYPGHSERWYRLAVTVAHELVLSKVAERNRAEVRFEHDTERLISQLSRRSLDIAVLVPPPTIQDLKALARSGERMPPKSTFFYPKLATGLVIYRHDAP